MAASVSTPSGEQATAPPTFSYAQAAKGRSLSGSTTQLSKAAPGTNGISKESKSTSPTSATPSINGTSEVGDATVELANGVGGGQSTTSQNSQPKGTASPPNGQTNGRSQNATSPPSSPSFGTSSISTLPKEDDVSSTPNLSSESTWDKQSQASVNMDKSSENGTSSSKDKEGEKEKVTPKILKEAPPPAVNFWHKRKEAQEAKTKVAAPLPAQFEPNEAEDSSVVRNGKDGKEKTSELVKPDSRKKGKSASAGAEDPSISQATAGKDKKRPTERDGRPRDEASRKINPRSKTLDKESQRMSLSAPPPVEDAVSWPTPESALGEEKKKVQEKGENTEKDRSPVRASGPRGKDKWVPVPYTPTVVYNTPLPTAARRGGRSSRGGREAGGRGAAHLANGSISSEKGNLGPGAPQQSSGQGEPNGRGRGEGAATRTPSLPPKPKRASSAGPFPRREQRRYGQPTANERRRDAESAFPKDSQTAASSSRRMSTATQTDGTQKLNPESHQFGGVEPSPITPLDNANAGTTGDNQGIDTHAHPKPNGPDRRLEGLNRVQENSRDLGNNVPHREREREGRSDRGRGGFRAGRGASNGFSHASQSPNSQFPNGHSPHQQHNASFSYPKTSASYNAQQSHQGQYGPGPRNHRGGPRSQSIPHTAPLYGRFPTAMPSGPQQVAPLQTHIGNVYDYPMHPMSAVPYNPYYEQYSIINMVAMQLDYYFSVDNLCKDMFLRKHMDSQGFVFLNVIADFNRIKQLTQDMELVRYVCFQSRSIEFRTGPDGLDRLRRREGWQQWVLSKEDRDPSAQNDGPVQIHQPRTPHPQGMETSYMDHSRQNMSPTEPGQNVDHDGAYQHMGGVTPNYLPMAPVSTLNGNTNGDSHPDFTPLSAAVPDFAPSGVPNEVNGPTKPNSQRNEGDSFPDEQIPHLMIIVRKHSRSDSPARRPFHTAASRTFSNGSIDGRTIADEISHPRPTTNGTTPDSSEPEKHLGARHSKSPRPNDPPIFWVKDKDTPIDALPEDLTVESYHVFRKNAMDQRESSAAGNCHRDMDILYQFWSHFLIRNFNSRMYGEFRRVAFEDAEKQSDVGMRNLVQYYDQALHSQKTISNDIARDYVELVKNEDAGKERLGFDKLRAAWRNGALNMKNRKKVDNVVDKELRTQLES